MDRQGQFYKAHMEETSRQEGTHHVRENNLRNVAITVERLSYVTAQASRLPHSANVYRALVPLIHQGSRHFHLVGVLLVYLCGCAGHRFETAVWNRGGKGGRECVMWAHWGWSERTDEGLSLARVGEERFRLAGEGQCGRKLRQGSAWCLFHEKSRLLGSSRAGGHLRKGADTVCC